MRIVGVATTLFVLACTPLTWMACSSETCVDRGNCADLDGGSTGDVTPGDGPTTFDAPPNCDLTKEPKDSAPCIDDAVGVFVSPNGDDSAPGKKSTPVKSIAKGVALAATKGLPRVYVCEGTYAEHVKLAAAVSLYGGFACVAWTYGGTKVRVQPTDGAKPALDLTSQNITIADFHILGAEQGAPNSVAVRVTDSAKIVFLRTRLEGRAGANGAPGVRADFTGFPSQTDLNGIDATGVAAGGERLVNCPGSQTTKGGKGGASGFDGDPGAPSLGGGGGERSLSAKCRTPVVSQGPVERRPPRLPVHQPPAR